MQTEFGYGDKDSKIVQDGKRLAEALNQPAYAEIKAALIAPKYDVWAVDKMMFDIPELRAIDDSGHSGHSWSLVMYVARELLRDSDTPSEFASTAQITLSETGSGTPRFDHPQTLDEIFGGE